jgi:TetR/AcrR family transcriptional regulator
MIPQRETVANPGQIRQKNEKIILDAAEQEFSANGYKGATIKKIADRAGLPKANIHYYFKSKLELYGAVLNNIVESTNSAFGQINSEDDPAEALAKYIRVKMQFSQENPQASRIFASEIISGAQYLGGYLRQELREWVEDKVSVFSAWTEQGKMNAVNPYHIIYLIWGGTQFYADSAVQVEATLGKNRLDSVDFVKATHSMISMILTGCGIRISDDMKSAMDAELASAKTALEAQAMAAVEFALNNTDTVEEAANSESSEVDSADNGHMNQM